MEVLCNFNRPNYHSNSLLCANLVPKLKSINCRNSFTHVVVYAIGKVTVDNRWSKLPLPLNKYFDLSAINEINVNNRLKYQNANYLSEIYFFQTIPKQFDYQEFINSEEGTVVQFMLPNDLLCSFKGLSVSVTYQIVLQFTNSNYESKSDNVLTYPFVVNSKGSSFSPYQAK